MSSFAVVLPLDSAEATLEVAGGKGAGLNRLLAGGFPVPPGFVVATDTYRAFVEANGLAERIVELARATPVADPAGGTAASAAIRQLFEEGSIPADLAAAICGAYRELGQADEDPPVAVRSSATAEDLPEASFAGQQETYLNVRGEVALLDAVKRCWSSLWTARALAYRARQGIDPATVSLAVVVQRLVPAEAAGVLFTVNPLTGSQDEAVINAAWGLGEAVIAGQVTPDTLVVDKATGQIKEIATGDKGLMTAPLASGTTEIEVPPERRRRAVLTPDQAAELTRLAGAIEARLGGPQDIEWALDTAGQWWILQARPVTALGAGRAPGALDPKGSPAPEPDRLEQGSGLDRPEVRATAASAGGEPAIRMPGGGVVPGREAVAGREAVSGREARSGGEAVSGGDARSGGEAVPGDDHWPAPDMRSAQPFDLWTQADMGERWPEPVTPLTWSIAPVTTNENFRYTFRGLKAPYLKDIQWAGRFFGRVYLNEGALAYVTVHEYGLPSSLVDTALGSQVGEARPAGSGFQRGVFLRRLPLLLWISLERLRNERVYQALFPKVDRWIAQFLTQDLGEFDDRALWHELSAIWLPRLQEAMNLHADATGSGMTVLPLLEKLLDRWAGRRELAQALIVGLSDVIAAEMVPMLSDPAREVRERGLTDLIVNNAPTDALAQLRALPEAQPVIDRLDAFLERHGHRCTHEAELLYPRWIEAPEQVIEALTGYLRSDESIDPEAATARQRRRRDEALAEIEARLNPARRAILRGLLTRTQHLVRLRDNGQNYLVKLLLPVRRIFAEFGRRWSQRGWLEHPDDIFFLASPEIAAVAEAGNPAAVGLDLPRLVAGRRLAYRHWFTVVAPDVIGPDGRPIAAPAIQEPAGAVPGATAPAGTLPAGGAPSGTVPAGGVPAGVMPPETVPAEVVPAETAPADAVPAGAASAGTMPAGNVLSGIAASAGRARGTARVIHHPREATHLQPGDILVTRATDPGWTPIFPLVGGVVLEVGGQLSHGAIVAREYGIPAVINVPGATQRIPDGQIVTVDGTAGRVYLDDAPARTTEPSAKV